MAVRHNEVRSRLLSSQSIETSGAKRTISADIILQLAADLQKKIAGAGILGKTLRAARPRPGGPRIAKPRICGGVGPNTNLGAGRRAPFRPGVTVYLPFQSTTAGPILIKIPAGGLVERIEKKKVVHRAERRPQGLTVSAPIAGRRFQNFIRKNGTSRAFRFWTAVTTRTTPQPLTRTLQNLVRELR